MSFVKGTAFIASVLVVGVFCLPSWGSDQKKRQPAQSSTALEMTIRLFDCLNTVSADTFDAKVPVVETCLTPVLHSSWKEMDIRRLIAEFSAGFKLTHPHSCDESEMKQFPILRRTQNGIWICSVGKRAGHEEKTTLFIYLVESAKPMLAFIRQP